MIEVNPNNGNETKSDIVSWDVFKSISFFIGPKIRKYFNNTFITEIS